MYSNWSIKFQKDYTPERSARDLHRRHMSLNSPDFAQPCDKERYGQAMSEGDGPHIFSLDSHAANKNKDSGAHKLGQGGANDPGAERSAAMIYQRLELAHVVHKML